MDQAALDQLARIGEICDALACHPAWQEQSIEAHFDRLACFDQEFWAFTQVLSRSLYEETRSLLLERPGSLQDIPSIAVVMAIHRPERERLQRALRSALDQLGVAVHLHLSLDGPEGDLPLVEQVLAELDCSGNQVSVHSHPRNRGVALCRNAALAKMQEDWFTFLDCDDIFHPLRLLHAWLVMRSADIVWLTTSCSRVSFEQGKIFLLHQCLSASGMNSFLARRSVLDRYGYLAPLRFWEDTEYQRRLARFQAPMLTCQAVGHYAGTSLNPARSSLALRWRQEALPVEGHPWLCGTVRGDLDAETRAIRDHYQALHGSLSLEQLPATFPPEGSRAGLPPEGSGACLPEDIG